MPPTLASVRSLPGRAALIALVALPLLAETAESPRDLVERGDAAWQRRAEGSGLGRAAGEPIGEAVSAYQRALDASPGSIPTRERLLRALYFQGRFATTEGPARRAIYARGRDLAEQGITRLAADLGAKPFDARRPQKTAAALAARPDAAPLFFWAAAHWGLWGETSGAFAAARQGVAARVRDHAEVAILIDERYEAGGGLRIRGRLHSEAPRIPLVTGWVSREVAVSSLERAVTLAPADPLNRLYLADALLRFQPQRASEARALLEALIAAEPRPGLDLEDGATIADARRILAREQR